jgi:mediator of RNA polymerase II transcription subunit 25
MASFSPDVAAQLQRLTPDQRGTFLNVMRHGQQQRHQQQQQQQFQPQQQSQQQLNYNLGAPNFGDSGRFDPTNFPPNGMNPLGSPAPGVNQTIGGPMMSMIGSQPGGMGGLHRRTPSGNAMPQAGGMSNVSYEVLQSFMQRNADGSGGSMGTSQ